MSFIIVAPSYNEKVGGALVLHKLCDLINNLGYTAYIWPIPHWPFLRAVRGCGFGISLRRTIKNFVRAIRGKEKPRFLLNHKLNTPLAKIQNLHGGFIAVYPETVDAIPLYSKHVVRWFLYKPNFHSSKVRYSTDELLFHYQDAFLDERLKSKGSSKFTILHLMTDIYRQTNFGIRRGSCHIIRKGKYKKLNHHNKDSIIIDNLTHEQAAKVFNQVEYCVSYDVHTMLAYYAVLCGCKVIVVPDEGVTVEQWQPIEEFRYGLAYGKENFPWAEKTRHLLLERLQRIEEQNIDSTKQFVERCISHFNLKS
ncbi:MAG: hypothetical protein L0H15_05040 [Nitrosospira sp.]|nr:hypothetical protein [Nitrosospira sp.]